MLEAARRVGAARGTVQARLDRLQRTGVIADLAPTIDPAALGYPVTAFLSLEIAQGRGRGEVTGHLAAIPEVIEVHTITGSADLLVRLVARSNADLQRVIDERGARSRRAQDRDGDRPGHSDPPPHRPADPGRGRPARDGPERDVSLG